MYSFILFQLFPGTKPSRLRPTDGDPNKEEENINMEATMKNRKSILAILLIAVLCLGLLAGCGEKSGGGGGDKPGGTATSNPGGNTANPSAAPAQDTYVYTAEYVPLQGDVGFLSSLTYADGRILTSTYGVIGDNTPEGVTPEYEGQYAVYGNIFYWINLDGSTEKLDKYEPLDYETEIEDATITSFSMGFDVAPDGTLRNLEEVFVSWYDGPEDEDVEMYSEEWYTKGYYAYQHNEEHFFLRTLAKDGSASSIQLPGKAFNIQIIDNTIYISTWNGFLLKVLRPENKLAWSRKIFSVPFLFTKYEAELHVASLDGDIQHLWDGSGQIRGNGLKIKSGIALLTQVDNMLAIATNSNRIYLYNTTDSTKEPIQLLMESSVSSLQTISFQGKKHILVGLADQTLLFYSSNGAPLWKFQGKNTIFNTPFVNNDLAWLDQGNEVVGISLKDGKVHQKFSTPGGAGTPFVLNRTLYSASSRRLLYGFSL